MEKLKYINKQMDLLSIPYQFGQWTSKVRYPYFVGEITEESPMTEDGFEESILILTGFNRGAKIELERAKEKIKKHFHSIFGLRGSTDGGTIAVFFDGSFFVPTGESGLEKIQINLKIKEWKGDI